MTDGGKGRAPAVRDQGSVAVLVLLFFVICLLLAMGTTTASAAFIAQRNLASVCDSAAVAAADEIDEHSVYVDGLAGRETPLSLDPQRVRFSVAETRLRERERDPHLEMTAVTAGDRVLVTCTTRVSVPFGEVFGYSEGLPRTAEAAAWIPLG